MKKIVTVLVVLLAFGTLVGCGTKVNESAKAFKEEYESVNGKTNKAGKEHRTVNISMNNPYEKISTDELLKKIDNKETFYVYFGDKLCPWCRSVIEKSIEVAKDKKIDKIYYINIWDDEGNEILRDVYTLENGFAVKKSEGTTNYYRLLAVMGNVLSDYNLTMEGGTKVYTGEKRIYAPNFVYFENGEAIKLVEGISEKQTDSREELTEEILKDEEKQFEEFFTN